MTELLVLLAAIFWTIIVAVVGFLKGYDSGWDCAMGLRDDMDGIMNSDPGLRQETQMEEWR